MADSKQNKRPGEETADEPGSKRRKLEAGEPDGKADGKVASSSYQTERLVEKLRGDATALLEKKDYIAALAALVQIAELDKESYVALLARAWTHLLENNADKALSDCRLIVERRKLEFVPTPVLIVRAKAYLMRGQKTEACLDLQSSIHFWGCFLDHGFDTPDPLLKMLTPMIDQLRGELREQLLPKPAFEWDYELSDSKPSWKTGQTFNLVWDGDRGTCVDLLLHEWRDATKVVFEQECHGSQYAYTVPRDLSGLYTWALRAYDTLIPHGRCFSFNEKGASSREVKWTPPMPGVPMLHSPLHPVQFQIPNATTSWKRGTLVQANHTPFAGEGIADLLLLRPDRLRERLQCQRDADGQLHWKVPPGVEQAVQLGLSSLAMSQWSLEFVLTNEEVNNFSEYKPNHDSAFVIGAGPVGLMAAIAIKRLQPQRSVLVLEKRELSRAFTRSQTVTLSARSVAFLVNIIKLDKQQLLDASAGDAGRGGIWIEIERLQKLLHLKARAIRVAFEFKSEVTEVVESKDATVTVRTSSGSATPCSLLVICSGAPAAFGDSFKPKIEKTACQGHAFIAVVNSKGPTGFTVNPAFKPSHGLLKDAALRVYCSTTDRRRIVAVAHLDPKSLIEEASQADLRALVSRVYKSLRTQQNASDGDIAAELRNLSNADIKPFPLSVQTCSPTSFCVGGKAVVSIQGDAARKPNFFAGSGINIGIMGLENMAESLSNGLTGDKLCAALVKAGEALHQELKEWNKAVCTTADGMKLLGSGMLR